MNLTSPKNWKIVKLGELADVKGGKRLPLGSDLVSYRTDHPYIRVTDIQDGKIKKDQLHFVPDDVFEKISRYIVDANDVVISIVGSVGLVAYIDEDLHKSSLTENCVRITEYKKDIDPRFLFWYLTSRVGQHDIASKTVGSTQPKLPIYNIRDLEIPLPSTEEQKEIAAILGSLDDKIELVRRENKTLESIAQTLFKEWFVDFKFPGHEKTKIVDGIPEGWKVGALGDVVEVKGGATPSTTNPDFWNGAIHWTSPKDLSDRKDIFLTNTEKKITEQGLAQIGSGLLPKGTLLLSSRAPIGYLAISDIDISINQGYIAMPPNSKFSNYFMYLWIKYNMQDIIGVANGSTFLEISKTSFKNLDCVIPPDNFLESFSNLTTPQFEKMRNNVLEIRNLSRLRDDLLNKIFNV
jgi:type I restriction enzyme S subunit